MGLPFISESKVNLQILNDFKEYFRNLINYGKSQLLFFNTPSQTEFNLGHVLGFRKRYLPFKYLGVSLV